MKKLIIFLYIFPDAPTSIIDQLFAIIIIFVLLCFLIRIYFFSEERTKKTEK